MPFGEVSTISTKFESFRAQHFRMLMENLCVLEETFVDSEALRLEKAIILQLGKVLAELEKIRTAIEEDTKPVASLSTWAEASEVDEKVL
ncbi:hypothetical protein JHK87_001137 [Glycine soja]|nr:hypothetical protein JHK87_001137 [Glycine soja]